MCTPCLLELTVQDLQLLPAPLPPHQMFNDIYNCRSDCIVDGESILSDSWSEEYPAGVTGARVPYAEVFRRTYRMSPSKTVGLSRAQARPIFNFGIRVQGEVDVKEQILHGLVDILNFRASDVMTYKLDWTETYYGVQVRDLIRFPAGRIRNR